MHLMRPLSEGHRGSGSAQTEGAEDVTETHKIYIYIYISYETERVAAAAPCSRTAQTGESSQ